MATAKRSTGAHVKWLTFKYMVVGYVLAKGEFKRVEDAADFADSLDLSYEQDYKNVPQSEWAALIERDFNEMKMSEAKNEDRH